MIFGGCTQSLAMLSSTEGIEASQQIAHELRADQNHRFHVRPTKWFLALLQVELLVSSLASRFLMHKLWRPLSMWTEAQDEKMAATSQGFGFRV